MTELSVEMQAILGDPGAHQPSSLVPALRQLEAVMGLTSAEIEVAIDTDDAEKLRFFLRRLLHRAGCSLPVMAVSMAAGIDAVRERWNPEDQRWDFFPDYKMRLAYIEMNLAVMAIIGRNVKPGEQVPQLQIFMGMDAPEFARQYEEKDVSEGMVVSTGPAPELEPLK